VSLLIAALLLLGAARLFGLRSPTFGILAIIAGNFAMFIAYTDYGIGRKTFSDLWIADFFFRPVVNDVIPIYSCLAAAVFGGGLAARLLVPAGPGTGTGLSDPKGMLPELHVEGAAYAALVVLLVCLTALYLAHATLLDWEFYVQYSTYLSVRDPAVVDVDVPILGALHRLQSLLGLLLAMILIASLMARRGPLVLLSGIIFSYLFVLGVGQGSRVASIQLGLLGFYLLAFRKGGTRLIGIALVLLAVVVLVRVLAIRGTGAYGFGPFFFYEEAGALEPLDSLIGILRGFLGGGFVLGAGFLADASAKYPLLYKVLSFSPLPSFLDGFEDVRHAEIRVNFHAPYSGILEAYLFGWRWFVLLLAAVGATTFVCEAIKRRDGVLAALPASLIFLAGFAFIQLYPLRNCIRIMLVALAIALAQSVWRRRLKSHVAADPVSPPPDPPFRSSRAWPSIPGGGPPSRAISSRWRSSARAAPPPASAQRKGVAGRFV
jgi:hypothetical protein